MEEACVWTQYINVSPRMQATIFYREKGNKKYPVSLKEKSFTLLANSISVAAAPGTKRLSLHIAWQVIVKIKINQYFKLQLAKA